MWRILVYRVQSEKTDKTERKTENSKDFPFFMWQKRKSYDTLDVEVFQ